MSHSAPVLTSATDFSPAQLMLETLRKRLAPKSDPVSVSSYRDLWVQSGLSGDAFANELSSELIGSIRMPYLEVSRDASLAKRFPPRFLRECGAYPFLGADGEPCIAVSEPPSSILLRSVQLISGELPRVVIVSFDELSDLLLQHLESGTAAVEAVGDAVENDLESLRDLASGAPVVRAIDELFERAAENQATDLHLEPMRDAMSVRLRIDGILRPIPAPPLSMAPALLSRLKILAGLDIGERRLPQDGSARLRIQGQIVDARVAILPCAHGESAVVRFLPKDRGLLELSRLGLASEHEKSLRRLLAMPNGILIITGPTGSGKTTTLASGLALLNDTQRKILTVEDPIEYELPGIVQTQVAPAIGLTFASALRSFLRLDPDIIMVGEIRDTETARIAVQAALTGHLVLTTLHTETAAAAMPRLLDLGVDDFLLQSTLRGIIAQRLVRLLCEHCKKAVSVTEAYMASDPRGMMIELRAGDIIYEPSGCERCKHTGFRGRTGIFELMEVTPPLRLKIKAGVNGPDIEDTAKAHGFKTMMADAARLCRAGRTSLDEVLRNIAER